MKEDPKKQAEEMEPPFIHNSWLSFLKKNNLTEELLDKEPQKAMAMLQAFYMGFASGINVEASIAASGTPELYRTLIQEEFGMFIGRLNKLGEQLKEAIKK